MKTHRILVIDDNEQNRYLATFLLEKAGFEVHCASDGARDLAAAQSLHPDLILMDIQMPTMDGYEVTRALNRSGETDRIPVVTVTSYAMEGDRTRAVDAGCVGYLENPIDPARFVDEVAAFLPASPSVSESP